MSNDDIITLGDTQFPITGGIVANAASDFEAGIKVGKAGYDNREAAFFIVMDDWTGGFGSKILNIREELGTYWFSGPKSPETSYAGRVTLPLKQEYIGITQAVGGFNANTNSISYPYIEYADGYLFGLGGWLFKITDLGDAPTVVDTSSYPITSVIRATDQTQGQIRYYLCRDNGTSTVIDLTNGGSAPTSAKFSLDGITWRELTSKTPQFNQYRPIQGILGEIVAQDTVMVYQQGTKIDTIALTTSLSSSVDADGTDNDSSTTSSTTSQQVISYPLYNYKIIPSLFPYPERIVPDGPLDGHEEFIYLFPYVTINGVKQDFSYGSDDTWFSQNIFEDDGDITVEPSGAGTNGNVNTVAMGHIEDLWENAQYNIEWITNIPTVTSYVPVEDLLFWDGKVLGVHATNKLVFLVPATGDGLNIYSLPAGTYIKGLVYTTIGSVQIDNIINTLDLETSSDADVDATGTASDVSTTATTTSQQVVLTPKLLDYHGWVVNRTISIPPDYNVAIDEGEEPWNLVVEGDEQVLASADLNRELRFIGIASAPWGEMAVYLRGGSRLYVLDFYSRKIFPIEIGSNRPIKYACMWNGVIVWTDGWEVGEFNPTSMTNRPLGLPSKWGIVPNLIGDDGPYQVIGLIPYDKELIAILVDPDEPATVLYKYNGIGWAQMGAVMHDFVAQYGFRVTLPLPGSILQDRAQAIILPGADAVSSPTSFGYWQFTLPTLSHTPTNRLDTFGDSGAYLYTGWLDGGFFDIDGTLLRMNIDAFFPSSSETIKVEYRLNNDPDDEEDATWTQMVDITGVPDVFDSTTDALYFDTDVPKVGIAYRTVQFRITFTRGSDETLTPELRALTLLHLKTPELRTTWTFTIDVDRMTQNNTGAVETFFIDGEVATVDSVWGKLRELWTNNHQLVAMTVPSALPEGETLYVKLTAIPLNLDDFRASVMGRGYVQVQVMEPIA